MALLMNISWREMNFEITKKNIFKYIRKINENNEDTGR